MDRYITKTFLLWSGLGLQGFLLAKYRENKRSSVRATNVQEADASITDIGWLCHGCCSTYAREDLNGPSRRKPKQGKMVTYDSLTGK